MIAMFSLNYLSDVVGTVFIQLAVVFLHAVLLACYEYSIV